VESAAEALYGLIHARFVLTGRGLAAVADRFRSSAFGRCPRLGCGGQAVLPLGPSDVPRQATVAVWCPRCEDAFRPPVKGAAALDGAYFTTTLPHLLLLTYPALRPPAPHPDDVPSARVFGFRVAERARAREPHGAPVTGWGVTAAAAAGRAAAAASNAPPAAGQRGEGGGAGGGADKAV
jgi:casein kinase II subunit beta